jgi:hypothetical protein
VPTFPEVRDAVCASELDRENTASGCGWIHRPQSAPLVAARGSIRRS